MADGEWSSRRGPVKDESSEKTKHSEVKGKDIATQNHDKPLVRRERMKASEARNPEKINGQNLMKTKENSNKDNPWSQSSDRKEGISFAEMLKRNYPSIEKPVLTPDSSRSKLATGSRPKRLNNDRYGGGGAFKIFDLNQWNQIITICNIHVTSCFIKSFLSRSAQFAKSKLVVYRKSKLFFF